MSVGAENKGGGYFQQPAISQIPFAALRKVSYRDNFFLIERRDNCIQQAAEVRWQLQLAQPGLLFVEYLDIGANFLHRPNSGETQFRRNNNVIMLVLLHDAFRRRHLFESALLAADTYDQGYLRDLRRDLQSQCLS